MRWKIAALLLGLATSATMARAEVRSFSTVDLRTSTPIDWQRLPSGEDLQRYYPSEAMQQRLEGRATISCAVDTRGYFHECLKLSEAPQGLGFGDAAVRMTPLYKVKAKLSTAGKPIPPPATVTFEVRFPSPSGSPR